MSLNLESAQAHAARRLRERGIDTAALDARALMKSATGFSLEELIVKGRDPLGTQAEQLFDGFVERRLAGEPVSRIRGTREFFGRNFKIDASTLDPRPDTETLIEAVLAFAGRDAVGQDLRLLDLGTGSGCILTTLLAELPRATGTGTDINPGAVRLARKNAFELGVSARAQFVMADWFQGLTGRYDVIVSNPPYIVSAEIEGLAPEVAHYDPRFALDGGADGLDAYRRIAARAGDFLAPNGLLLVEIGVAQAVDVESIFRSAGLAVTGNGATKDLAGRPRCICAKISSHQGCGSL
ncbi:MAG: peptide chain release factor N(5)-glutamine methyltransferase [Pseudomonadota bacterium]